MENVVLVISNMRKNLLIRRENIYHFTFKTVIIRADIFILARSAGTKGWRSFWSYIQERGKQWKKHLTISR